MKKRFICYALVAALLISVFPMEILAAGPTFYTYTWNEWEVPVPSPDAYRPTAFILGQHLYFEGENIGQWRMPQDIHVWYNHVYVVDSGNNRIIVLEFYGENYSNHRVIDYVTHVTMPNGQQSELNNPHGLFISEWALSRGEIFIADTGNNRVLHTDENWNVITEILHPGNHRRCEYSDGVVMIYDPGSGASLLGVDSDFQPGKVVADFSGRIFVQVMGVNRGLMEFDRYGVFAGYMGAPDVDLTVWDQFWRLIAFQAQRERRRQAVPVEFNNVSIDREGFLFVTTASEDIDPVQRLNALGDDVMIRNDFEYPIGDIWFGQGGDRNGPSEFIDVTTLPNGIFVAFDRNRGRLFAYDEQGHLLYAWGGAGNREGFFQRPTAIDSMGYSIFALDGSTNAVLTKFTLTDYGLLINEALYYYLNGDYERSAAVWEDVLRINGNFGRAYIGIARALLRQGYYRDAMRIFRQQNDNENYGRAFGFYRRIWMEQYFWMFALGLGIIMIVPPVIKKILKVRREIKES
ncbi:MAG: hypothetical protein FWF79_06485 [Defluviitaleaceae bacterium]|nr:hypothetical protein [Defluviitaleaceae bacterium]